MSSLPKTSRSLSIFHIRPSKPILPAHIERVSLPLHMAQSVMEQPAIPSPRKISRTMSTVSEASPFSPHLNHPTAQHLTVPAQAKPLERRNSTPYPKPSSSNNNANGVNRTHSICPSDQGRRSLK